ncbi:class GN sortase [Kiloniella sp. EL199]|uniref:class GN sortase n=1 Tax=Kiloniella sp. EL199 TaxID=2107581 RepID=UPI000EA2A423|nr:class GN sortase [Kiloniella sp. EL199]
MAISYDTQPVSQKGWLAQYLARGTRKFLLLALFITGFALIGDGLYIKLKAVLAQHLLQQAWQETLTTQTPQKAWSWADTYPVAEISLPDLTSEPVIALRGSSGEALAFAPGHLENTALPGQQGTAVYAAHRDTHFAFLENIKATDTIKVKDPQGRDHLYKVDNIRITKWDQSGITNQNTSKRIALVTCWPFDAQTPGPLRYIVEGQLIENLSAD